METGIHELTAGYALDALDPDEREAFEQHLAGCEQCQRGARVVLGGHGRARGRRDGPAPSPELRERILAGARAETQNVVPLESRRRCLAGARRGHGDRSGRRDRARHLRDLAQQTNSTTRGRRSRRTRSAAAVLADPSATTVALRVGLRPPRRRR